MLAPAIGAAVGWFKGKRGEAQHEEMTAKENELKKRVTALETSHAAAISALNPGWSGRVGKKPEARFIDKTTLSAQNGRPAIGG